jgi:hypothetical protein
MSGWPLVRLVCVLLSHQTKVLSGSVASLCTSDAERTPPLLHQPPATAGNWINCPSQSDFHRFAAQMPLAWFIYAHSIDANKLTENSWADKYECVGNISSWVRCALRVYFVVHHRSLYSSTAAFGDFPTWRVMSKLIGSDNQIVSCPQFVLPGSVNVDRSHKQMSLHELRAPLTLSGAAQLSPSQ